MTARVSDGRSTAGGRARREHAGGVAARTVRGDRSGDATGRYVPNTAETSLDSAFRRCSAAVFGAPDPGRIPAWLARFFVGTVNAKGFTRPMPTTNERAKRDLGWEPSYPTYREGLEQVVGTWRADGTLADLRDDPATEATDPVGEGAT